MSILAKKALSGHLMDVAYISKFERGSMDPHKVTKTRDTDGPSSSAVANSLASSEVVYPKFDFSDPQTVATQLCSVELRAACGNTKVSESEIHHLFLTYGPDTVLSACQQTWKELQHLFESKLPENIEAFQWTGENKQFFHRSNNLLQLIPHSGIKGIPLFLEIASYQIPEFDILSDRVRVAEYPFAKLSSEEWQTLLVEFNNCLDADRESAPPRPIKWAYPIFSNMAPAALHPDLHQPIVDIWSKELKRASHQEAATLARQLASWSPTGPEEFAFGLVRNQIIQVFRDRWRVELGQEDEKYQSLHRAEELLAHKEVASYMGNGTRESSLEALNRSCDALFLLVASEAPLTRNIAISKLFSKAFPSPWTCPQDTFKGGLQLPSGTSLMFPHDLTEEKSRDTVYNRIEKELPHQWLKVRAALEELKVNDVDVNVRRTAEAFLLFADKLKAGDYDHLAERLPKQTFLGRLFGRNDG